MVRNLRSYFILYVIIFNGTMCVREKMEFSNILQRPKLSSTDMSGDITIAMKIEQL